MVEPADRPSAAGQRLGAPESFGVSTLEPGLRPPVQPPGRQVSIRVQMLDDTQETFQISVSRILVDTLMMFVGQFVTAGSSVECGAMFCFYLDISDLHVPEIHRK